MLYSDAQTLLIDGLADGPTLQRESSFEQGPKTRARVAVPTTDRVSTPA